MPRHFRIFLSSPGDVAQERQIARQVIESVLPEREGLKGRATFEIVDWEKLLLPGWVPPQEAINQVARPSDCDLTLVILWGRMGTPVTVDGKTYRSGTEWKCEDAKAVDPGAVFVFHRTQPPRPKSANPDELLAMANQAKALQGFMEKFRNEDGSYRGSVKDYDDPSDFGRKLADRLAGQIFLRKISQKPDKNTSKYNTLATERAETPA